MRFAVIENSIVTNVVEGDLQNVKAVFPLNSQVVNVNLFPVGIGDSYIEGVFTRDGVVIERMLSDGEQLAKLLVSDATKNERIDELTMMVLESGGALVG